MAEPLRVLIVDDEVMLVMAMEDVLADAGHIVVGTAASKKEALKIADATRPDLVLLDIHLFDGPTGLEIAEHLRDVVGITIVFMTASERKLPSDYAGAFGIIAKPFTQAGVVAVIDYLAKRMRQPPPHPRPPHEFILASDFAPSINE